jgi:hypothetical protein
MNEQLKEEIESLRRTHGFEEDEAVAYWHLAEARRLMISLVIEDEEQRRTHLREAYDELLGLQRLVQETTDTLSHATKTETSISQDFSALYRELGLRVLRRSHPEGWTDTRI